MHSFPDPIVTAGKIRYQTALRTEMLRMTGYRSWKQGHTHGLYAKSIWNTQDDWLTCLYLAGGRYRIFQNDLKSQKIIPRCNCLWMILNFWKRCIPCSELVEKRIEGGKVHTLTSLTQEKRSLLLNPSTSTKPWYMVPGAEHWQACWMGWPRAQKSDSKLRACVDCLVVYSLFISAMTFLLE